jgi:hypothetical protein
MQVCEVGFDSEEARRDAQNKTKCRGQQQANGNFLALDPVLFDNFQI